MDNLSPTNKSGKKGGNTLNNRRSKSLGTYSLKLDPMKIDPLSL